MAKRVGFRPRTALGLRACLSLLLVHVVLTQTREARASDPQAWRSETIEAKYVRGKIDPKGGGPAWRTASPKIITLFPQTTLRLSSAKANAAIAKSRPRLAQVKMIYNATFIAVAISWQDETHSIHNGKDVDLFADAVAVEFPVSFGAPRRLPHIGMGDDKSPVMVYFQRAMAVGTYERQYIGEGFGFLRRVSETGIESTLRYDRRARRWRAVFVRPLKGAHNDLGYGLVPVAFALWDGERHERGGNKALSGWKLARLDRYPLDASYAQQLFGGAGVEGTGSAERGQALARKFCVACHRLHPSEPSLQEKAPDLFNIGSIATEHYLMSSMTKPNEVVMRHPRNGGSDSDGYRWHEIGETGARVSKMPSFELLPVADRNDVVAYLKSLRLPESEASR